MINLLVHTDSFRWNDIAVNRKEQLDDLVLLQQQIQIDKKCKTYKTPAFDNLSFDWGYFYDIIDPNFDFKTENAEWLKPCVQPMSNSIFLYLFGYQYTPKQAETITDLDTEFKNDANVYLGIDKNTPRLVYNTYTYDVLKASLIPVVEPANWSKIRKEIELGKILPAFFERIDTPTITAQGNLHGEQVHIHFKNGTALNLDGSWKHKPKNEKDKKIPTEAQKYLLEWGFTLPK
jgi:hypothetical protein